MTKIEKGIYCAILILYTVTAFCMGALFGIIYTEGKFQGDAIIKLNFDNIDMSNCVPTGNIKIKGPFKGSVVK